MSTRMTNTERTTAPETRKSTGIWPWVILALVIVAGLWFASAANDHGVNNPNYNNSSQPFGVSPVPTPSTAPGE